MRAAHHHGQALPSPKYGNPRLRPALCPTRVWPSGWLLPTTLPRLSLERLHYAPTRFSPGPRPHARPAWHSFSGLGPFVFLALPDLPDRLDCPRMAVGGWWLGVGCWLAAGWLRWHWHHDVSSSPRHSLPIGCRSCPIQSRHRLARLATPTETLFHQSLPSRTLLALD